MKKLLLLTALSSALPLWLFAQVQSIRPDSIVETNTAGQNISKNVFTYDTDGNPTVHLFYEWNERAGIWEENEREVTDYFEPGHPDSTILFVWENNMWTKSEKTQCFYEAAGCTLIVVSNWDADNAVWIEQEKEEFTLGSDGKPTLMVQYEISFDPGSGAGWQESEKTVYTYANGKLSRTEESYYENNQWYPNSATNYTYDGNNHLIQEEEFSWSIANSQWVQDEKTVYTYGDDGNITKDEVFAWVANAYALERISTYFYPAFDGIESSGSERSVRPYAVVSGNTAYLYGLPEQAQLTLYSPSGAIVQQTESASGQCLLPLPARGQYFVVITAGTASSVVKFGY